MSFLLLRLLKLQLLQSSAPRMLTSVWCDAGSNFLLSYRENQLSSINCSSVPFLYWIPVDTGVENPLSTNSKADCHL